MPGKEGVGLTTKSSFSVPREGIGWWSDRLKSLEIDAALSADSQEITFRDNDGMQLSLVATDNDARSGWDGVGAIPQEYAVRGLHSVTLSQNQVEPTGELLISDLGMKHSLETATGSTFTMGDGGSGAQVEVLGEFSKKACKPAEPFTTLLSEHQTLPPWKPGAKNFPNAEFRLRKFLTANISRAFTFANQVVCFLKLQPMNQVLQLMNHCLSLVAT